MFTYSSKKRTFYNLLIMYITEVKLQYWKNEVEIGKSTILNCFLKHD